MVVVVVAEVEVVDLAVVDDEVPGTDALAPHPALRKLLRASTTPTPSRAEIKAFLDRSSGTS